VTISNFIYLDHAAATPLDERVLAAMSPYFTDKFYNPSSPYSPALGVRREYQAAKARLAACIGGKADELVMTAGATESINLAIRGVGGHVVTAAAEHEAVLAAVRGGEHSIVPVDERGRVSPEEIREAIRPDTRLVTVALANGELGTIQPLSEIAAVVREERARRRESGNNEPIYFHSDASQGAGLIDIHVARLGVDLLTVNAAKLYGPKQVAMLWIERSVQLSPYIVGGGQEGGLRSGTENVAGVIGFASALELAESHRKSEGARLAKLRDELQARLIEALPGVVVSGDIHHRLASHLHVSFPGIDGERLVFALEARGVLVATGSACAANKGKRSHVLSAIGLSPEVADGSLRLSLGRLTDEETCKRAAHIIIEEVQREYRRIGK
jgi:cysteine desulfurase